MREERGCSIDTLFARAVQDSLPLSALFELTHRCNLRCSHCYVADRGEKELSLREITGILAQLAAENCLFLTLTGGEALLREDFLEVLSYAKGQGFALRVFTNGNLIDEGMAQEMGRFQPLEVGISIYGADAATHDRFTGVPGSFHRSLRALRLLKEQGVLTIVKCLLMKENVAQVKDIRALSQEVGAIIQYDPLVSPRNDGNRDPLQHQLAEDDLHWLFSRWFADPREVKAQTPRLAELIPCRAGRDSCCISPGGEVYPCVALPVSLGNLRRQSFAEVWRGAAATEMRKLRFADLKQCVSCPDLDFCTRCWGLAVVESGDSLGPSYLNCRIARVRHRISVERGEAS